MGLHSEGPEGPRPTPMVLSINEQGNYPKNDVVLWGVPAPTNVKQVWKVVSTKNQANRAEDRAGQKGQNKNAPCPDFCRGLQFDPINMF